MEIITEFVQNQLALVLPVALAIFGCIFVFTYAIRPAQQPKFKLSSLDDRKTAGKKKKLKEKKTTVNGHVSTGLAKSEKSPVKEQKKSPEPQKKEKKVENGVKETKKEKIEVSKRVSEPQESKKKANKKPALAKPLDFDDGDWETVPTKADKKKKPEQSPVKKERKSKAQPEVQVAIKETTPEADKETATLEEVEVEVKDAPESTPEEVPESVEEPAPVIEEKKDKRKKKQKVVKPQQSDDAEDVAPKSELGEPQVTAVSVEEPNDVPAPTSTPSGAAFDELGDTWTEAKAVKKSKKKTRRDN